MKWIVKGAQVGLGIAAFVFGEKLFYDALFGKKKTEEESKNEKEIEGAEQLEVKDADHISADDKPADSVQ